MSTASVLVGSCAGFHRDWRAYLLARIATIRGRLKPDLRVRVLQSTAKITLACSLSCVRTSACSSCCRLLGGQQRVELAQSSIEAV